MTLLNSIPGDFLPPLEQDYFPQLMQGLSPSGIVSKNADIQLPGDVAISVSQDASRDDSDIPLDTDKLLQCPAGWQELPDYSESWQTMAGQRGSQEVTRTFQGPWGSRFEFAQWALGWCDNVAGAPSGTGLMRSNPAQHPEQQWLYATAVRDVRGQGVHVQNPNLIPKQTGTMPLPQNPLVNMIAFVDADSGSDYLSCKLQVVYSRLMFNVRSDADIANNGASELQRNVIRTKTRTVRSLPIPDAHLVFQGTNNPISAASGNVLVPQAELTYTWVWVPDVPEDAINSCIGKVNSVAFDPRISMNGRLVGFGPAAGYPPGTLLCQPPETTEDRGTTGREQWTIVYKLQYNPVGWNYFPDSTGTFQPAVYKNGGGQLYQSVDLNQLFVLPAPVNYF